MEPCRCHHRTQKAIFLQNGLTNSQVGAMLAPDNMLQTTCKILAKRGPILRTVFWTPVWGSNLRPRAVKALALLFACLLGHPSACLLEFPFFYYWGCLFASPWASNPVAATKWRNAGLTSRCLLNICCGLRSSFQSSKADKNCEKRGPENWTSKWARN